MSPLERISEVVNPPIESGALERVGDTVLFGIAAVAINNSGFDAMTGGYGADIIGLTAEISFLSMFFQRKDPQALPVGTGLAIAASCEYMQQYHVLEGVPVLSGLDGVYDVRDFAAYALGTLLYMGTQKTKNIFRSKYISCRTD
jgi:hypothetical protein